MRDRTRNEAQCHPHVPEERAELFRCYDGGSTEIEYLQLLHALICCLKPGRVLETGTWNGHSTVAIASALRKNCFGHLVSVEADAAAAQKARDRLCDRGLHNAVVHTSRSIDFLKDVTDRFDFAFLDSDLTIRVQELRLCVDRGLLTRGALVAIHDTSRVRTREGGQVDRDTKVFWDQFDRFRAEAAPSCVLELPYSRGLLIVRL
jgi:predicted O-methyltransferase YrrM